jgi:very-long-chain ceramide synthase
MLTMFIGVSLNLLALLCLVHLFFPKARGRTRKFVEMSYKDPATGLYGRGWDDMYLVTFYIVLLTGLRAAAMDYVFTPLARWGRIPTKKARVRFAEQAWILAYYTVFWILGMVSL